MLTYIYLPLVIISIIIIIQGDLGGSKGETECDGEEKVGMIRAWEKKTRNRKHQSSCKN